MKKKVIFLSDVEYFKGGAEKSLFDVMTTRSIDPVLAVPEEGDLSGYASDLGIPFIKIDYGNVLTVHRPFKLGDIPRVLGAAMKAARQLNKSAKENGAIAVHSNGLKAHGIACLAGLLGRAKPVLHYRAIPYTGKEKLFWKVTQMIAAKLVLVSRPCWPGETLPSNVQVIFNGIKPMDKSVLPERARADTLALAFIGRIHPSKGLKELIEWFDEAYQNGLKINLSIRGEATEEDKIYYDEVVKIIGEKGLSDVIKFEGKLEGYENIYADIDAVIVPSITPDPLPRTVMEASALGIPVLGYPAGGIVDMIDDGKNGFLVKDSSEFQQTLKRLIEEDGLYEKISKAAIENARQKFSLESLHKGIEKLYAGL
jgi:glycosyltransferase involved in cell wall biosynthesis